MIVFTVYKKKRFFRYVFDQPGTSCIKPIKHKLSELG